MTEKRLMYMKQQATALLAQLDNLQSQAIVFVKNARREKKESIQSASIAMPVNSARAKRI
jgi:hypothetical protein